MEGLDQLTDLLEQRHPQHFKHFDIWVLSNLRDRTMESLCTLGHDRLRIYFQAIDNQVIFALPAYGKSMDSAGGRIPESVPVLQRCQKGARGSV